MQKSFEVFEIIKALEKSKRVNRMFMMFFTLLLIINIVLFGTMIYIQQVDKKTKLMTQTVIAELAEQVAQCNTAKISTTKQK